jgi:CRISPR-associated endonuclease Cas2
LLFYKIYRILQIITAVKYCNMPKKDLNFSSKILLWLLAAGDVVSLPISSREMYKAMSGRRNTFEVTLYRLYKKGWIKYIDKEGLRFCKLTKSGQIEALLAKAILPQPQSWDGKWRMFIFDIPEVAQEKRHLLRSLLKRNGYKKLQASVYVNPYPLNREAVSYLKETKLINYIRIIKVEEMDYDKDLRKEFNLN